MNQREKILALLVGGLLLVVGLQLGLSSFRNGLEVRKTKLRNLEDKLANQQEEEFAGLQAESRIMEYRRRSLPSDPQRAQAQYKEWLEKLVGASGLENRAVDYVGEQGSNKLYRIYTFRISGIGNIQRISEFLAAFHEKNYLQRAKKLLLRPAPGKNGLLMNIDVEAIALNDAATDQPAPSESDPRLAEVKEELVRSVINRNMFSPANRPPRYAGDKSITASIDTDFAARLRFSDPDEGNRVEYEVVGELPPGLQFNSGELIGRPKEKGEYEFVVRAWDDGMPSREVRETLVLKVGDPPPKPAPVEGPPPFDESQQAVLTGLVQSRGQWNAWINVRTQNKLLKLKPGDTFKVGTIEGTITEVTDRYAVFESDGESYTLRHDSSLADAKNVLN
ncbi:MAG: cadherin repeat domain-containing protein [Pirellulaceae bacterium]